MAELVNWIVQWFVEVWAGVVDVVGIVFVSLSLLL